MKMRNQYSSEALLVFHSLFFHFLFIVLFSFFSSFLLLLLFSPLGRGRHSTAAAGRCVRTAGCRICHELTQLAAIRPRVLGDEGHVHGRITRRACRRQDSVRDREQGGKQSLSVVVVVVLLFLFFFYLTKMAVRIETVCFFCTRWTYFLFSFLPFPWRFVPKSVAPRLSEVTK
jgi:hypothetical protein